MPFSFFSLMQAEMQAMYQQLIAINKKNANNKLINYYFEKANENKHNTVIKPSFKTVSYAVVSFTIKTAKLALNSTKFTHCT